MDTIKYILISPILYLGISIEKLGQLVTKFAFFLHVKANTKMGRQVLQTKALVDELQLELAKTITRGINNSSEKKDSSRGLYVISDIESKD